MGLMAEHLGQYRYIKDMKYVRNRRKYKIMMIYGWRQTNW